MNNSKVKRKNEPNRRGIFYTSASKESMSQNKKNWYNQPHITRGCTRNKHDLQIAFCMYKMCTSHIGLIVILLLYSVIGAVIFMYVEGRNNINDNEMEKDLLKHDTISSILEKLRNITLLKEKEKNDLVDILSSELNTYERRMELYFKETSSNFTWCYLESLFFCFSVYTTIGFGNLYPVTTSGKWATLVYGFFGIPLCLTTLADIGSLFRKVIQRTCTCKSSCGSHNLYQLNKDNYKTALRTEGKANIALNNHLHDDQIESNCRTHSYNDVELNTCAQHSYFTYATFTTKETSSKDVNKPKQYATKSREAGPQEDVIQLQSTLSHRHNNLNTPVLVPLVITLTYILSGVAFYCIALEYTFTDSFYFILISFSTIGFGDIIPSISYFFFYWLYTLIGLSLVAMVINFMTIDTGGTIEKAKVQMERCTAKGLV